MCESCEGISLGRREFLTLNSALGASVLMSNLQTRQATGAEPVMAPRDKQRPRVLTVFLYPPADVVTEGKMEDSWAPHQWFTWPGNQFQPEEQQRKFTAKIREMGQALGIDIDFAPRAIYQQAKVEEFIAQARESQPDAVLIVNFWNTLSKAAYQLATESAPTAIVYHSVGSNHQLPPESLRTAEGLYYIHSIENFDEIERGLRAVRAKKMLSQSRLLRVSGRVDSVVQSHESTLDVEIVAVPAEELNAMFDAIADDDLLRREAMEFKQLATQVTDVDDQYFVDAMRAHRAVKQIVQRYGADAITIECLMLKHRKPCISFAVNNGDLFPCGCENHLDPTLTLMLGRWLLDRAWIPAQSRVRHQRESVLWGSLHVCLEAARTAGAEQAVCRTALFPSASQDAGAGRAMDARRAGVVDEVPGGQRRTGLLDGSGDRVAGVAAHRWLRYPRVDVDRRRPGHLRCLSGPHPVLYCGDRGDARRFKAFARMYRLALEGNV
jgi:hypothetical protein